MHISNCRQRTKVVDAGHGYTDGMPTIPSDPIRAGYRQGAGRRSTGWLLLVATTLGAPSGLIFVFREVVKENPWLAVGALVIYEVLLLVGAMATKVWRRLESHWVDKIGTAIETRVSWYGYRRRYLRYMIDCHCNFDVKGLTTQSVYTLGLDEVFVDLTIKPSPVHGVSADPIRSVPEELRGKRQIWDYLVSEALKSQHLAVIGAPGSGKTTLLKKIALSLAQDPQNHAARLRKLQHKIPILLFLRDLAEAIQQAEAFSLVQAVSRSLARKQAPAPPPGWLAAQLKAGRCAVLLDGLDEVASTEDRKAVADWVENQMQAHGENRFLVTSRPYGYQSNPLIGVTLLEVQSFNRAQVRRFVTNWYRANETMSAGRVDPGVEIEAREGARDLLRRLWATPTLAALAVNPLLLTMISTVHRYRSSLPGRRVELYDEICEVFLGKRRQARGLDTDLAPSQKKLVLQALAYHLMKTNCREIPASEAVEVIAEPLESIAGTGDTEGGYSFLKMIEQTSGLLLERENAVYGFAHKAFQEYLAAEHIRERRLDEDLTDVVGDPWWEEVIRLYSAKGDASPIIAACLKADAGSPKALALAFDCIEEARSVDPKLRRRLDRLIEDGVDDQAPEVRRVVAEAILTRRLRRMVSVDDNVSIDPEYITQAEYQLFLDEKRTADEHVQPDHWIGRQFPEGQGALPVVGLRPSDARAFCGWLNERDQVQGKYRLPLQGEISGSDIVGLEITGTAKGFWSFSDEVSVFEEAPQIGERPPDDCSVMILNVLKPALKRALERARAFERARALDLKLKRAVSRASALDRTQALEIDRDRDLHQALGRAFDRIRAHDVERALEQACSSRKVCVLDLDRALEFARDLDIDVEGVLNRARASLKDRTLHLNVVLGCVFDVILDGIRAPNLGHALEVVILLTTLKLRLDGDLVPFEGLRIVREKIVDDAE
jgi:energy-coupling factor transporter ATP-binding protein EcfA2